MSNKLSLKAAPGKVLLVFPNFPDEEQQTESGIFVPVTSVQIPEVAQVLDVGEPITPEDRVARAYFLERKENGEGVLADYAAGQSFWRQNLDKEKWGWLKPIRAYRLSAPSAHIEITEEAV